VEQHENYLTDLLNWCSDLYEYSKQFQSNNRQLNGEAIEEWEKEMEQFKTTLGNPTGNESFNELYDKAQDLYMQWEHLYMLNDEGNVEEHKQQKEEDVKGNRSSAVNNGGVPIGGHQLPPLPYSYDALEPYIDREIMKLHHTKHHQGYVDGLNKAEKEMQKARNSGDFNLIKHWEREAAFNGAGHYLHTIFWDVMSPQGGGKPIGKTKDAINQTFGSFEKFKKHFSEAAKNVEAVGWAILVWSPRSHRLEILQAEKHQNLSQWDIVPLLVLDVWEHAYYLQYKNERKRYVDNWWNVVDWKSVENRFKEAEKLKWKPF
jgi:superoxide dismutase, Fe-Mn family